MLGCTVIAGFLGQYKSTAPATQSVKRLCQLVYGAYAEQEKSDWPGYLLRWLDADPGWKHHAGV